MAQRRMFSNKIIGSARFLKMPVDTQALYFHLALQADDDGIVEAYPILKMVGASEDNLKILAAKNFVTVLNEDLVSFIMDWTEHNKIRADRKVDSIYKPLLLQMLPNVSLIEPKKRADVQMTSSGRPVDRIGKVRLGKDSIGKDRKENKNKFIPPSLSEAYQYIISGGYDVDASAFVDHYTANGWMRNKTKVKDWKACVRTWNRSPLDNPREKYNPVVELLTGFLPKRKQDWPTFSGRMIKDAIDAVDLRSRVIGYIENEDTGIDQAVLDLIEREDFINYLAVNQYAHD